jgi:hypothetical protein
MIRPETNDRPNDVRVIDEEGEDYLYSADQFVPIDLPPKVRKAISVTVTTA